jgi:hypothetical protein
MTWTQINSKALSKYDGMSPADIGRAFTEYPDSYTIELFYIQEMAHTPNTEPWRVKVDDLSWMDFWKPVYDLENKPMSEYTLDDWFGMRALTNLLPHVPWSD